jgi:hypothetical protein
MAVAEPEGRAVPVWDKLELDSRRAAQDRTAAAACVSPKGPIGVWATPQSHDDDVYRHFLASLNERLTSRAREERSWIAQLLIPVTRTAVGSEVE